MSVHAPAARPWTLFSDRNFGLFWLSQTVSSFGDQLTVIALAALVWQMTHSSFYTALIIVATTIPHAVFGFFAGPVADGLGRKQTLVICDLVRMFAIGSIPPVLWLGLPLGVVFVLVLVATFCAALFAPTKLALLPDLVPAGAMASGNSFVQLSDRTVEIGGKVVAGFLFLALGTNLFYVDAFTFLVSALLLMRVTLRDAPTGLVSFRSVLADAGTGLRVIGENAVLAGNLFFSLLAQVSVAVLNTLTPVYLFREFAAGADAFGAAEAALAAGFVVFSIGMPALIARNMKGRLVIAGFAMYGLVLLGLSLVTRLEGAFALFFLAGIANTIFLIPNITIYQEHTPPEFRGRVFSTRYALLNLVWLPVMIVSGALAESMSTAVLIGIAGAFTLVVAIVGSFFRAVREVR